MDDLDYSRDFDDFVMGYTNELKTRAKSQFQADMYKEKGGCRHFVKYSNGTYLNPTIWWEMEDDIRGWINEKVWDRVIIGERALLMR